MRYAIFSDVHSNLEALQAVLAACRAEGARKLFCAGDIVGYGANPKECIDLLRELNITCVAGNHDWAVCGRMDYGNFRDEGKKAIDWTKKVLSTQYIEFLNKLDLTFKTDEFVMVHATLNKPNLFQYLLDMNQSQDTFYLMDRTVCFVGHTHRPQIFAKQNDSVSLAQGLKIEINFQFKYIVNAGSVGQPRDGNPQACLCIFDPDLNRIEVKRVTYDIAGAQKKILEAGLPEMLARRLSVGQ